MVLCRRAAAMENKRTARAYWEVSLLGLDQMVQFKKRLLQYVALFLNLS